MKYKTLGRTDLDVSQICLGTMTWGLQNNEAEGHEQMDYALEQGINFFDTAELYAVPPSEGTYGKTETIIGTWFKKTGNRDKVILASKIVGAGLPWVRDGGDITSDSVKIALDDSLKRLQTDYIDLYQLHWPNRGGYHFSQQWGFAPNFDKRKVEENFVDVLETLDALVKEGKIRHIGLSNETAWGTMKWLRLSEEHNLPRMVSIQNEYSLLNRPFDTDLHEVAVAEDCGLLAWSPLAGGLISGKYLYGARPKGTRWDIEERFLERDTKAADNAVTAYIAVAEKHGLDVCQMALAFVNQQPFVTSNIIGATSMEQLKSNIASIDITLSQDVLDDIATTFKQFPMVY
ncbi:MAG: aldo/keto reductase [Alphaproteobacteria bacterium]|nr:MAG: aldo/keto reductase [Alphaproteobacteria bacterium]